MRLVALLGVVASCGGGGHDGASVDAPPPADARTLVDAPNIGTSWGTDITTSTTWSLDMCPIRTQHTIHVGNPQSATPVVLTIEAGCEVTFDTEQALWIETNGGLRVLGTPSMPVHFTGMPGWEGIWMLTGADSTNLELDDVVIDQARDALLFTDVTPLLHNVTATASFGGLALRGSAALAPGSSGLVLDAGVQVVEATPEAVFSLPTAGSTYSGGPGAVITVSGGMIAHSGTWNALGVPYAIGGTLYVSGVPAPILTIAPGATLSFADQTSLVVGEPSNGGLIATGTAAAPITFTGSPTKGAWVGLVFYQAASASVLDHVVVEWGGGQGMSGYTANISVEDGNAPAISNSTSWRSAGAGIDVMCPFQQPGPTITNITYGTSADADQANLVTHGCP